MKPQPSSTNKIEISLYEYETKSYPYLWTALMILGMVLPNKFGNESIKSRASFRDYLDTQQGFFSRFSSNSIYEREFKIHLNEEMVKYFLEEFLSKYKKKLHNEHLKRVQEDELHKKAEITRINLNFHRQILALSYVHTNISSLAIFSRAARPEERA